jgi:hypothetical protein
MVWVFLFESQQICFGTRFGQRTASVHVGQQYLASWIQYFGGFGHKKHASYYYNIGIATGRKLSHLQTIANKIGYILYFWPLVIMGDDGGVLLLFKELKAFVEHVI